MTPTQLKQKWVNTLYPEMKGKGRNKRLSQRGAFMMGYERAILDVKAQFLLAVKEETNGQGSDVSIL
jgi:hypothetical protein